MRTLGMDLAASDANTAACVIVWGDGRAVVQTPLPARRDSALLAAIGDADHVGIEAPFGWPDEFLTS